MSFWSSDLGRLTGDSQDAFARTYKIIPDGTMAIAKINSFCLVEKNGKNHYEVEWQLIDGDFKNQAVVQKIHAFDVDSKKKHRALNMLMLLFKMYGIKPATNAAPTDQELAVFQGKLAGVRIGEWSMPKDDGTMMEGNWVSEVHPAEGFKSETGIKLEVTHTRSSVDSAFSRNERSINPEIDSDDIPF